jgi:hypothetical protein
MEGLFVKIIKHLILTCGTRITQSQQRLIGKPVFEDGGIAITVGYFRDSQGG